MNAKQTARFLLDVHDDNRKRPILTAGKISYANWWKMNPENYWFTRFIRHYFPEYAKEQENVKPIRFYSVFGPKKTSEEPFEGIKIFFSGENLEDYIRYEGLKIREVSDKVWHVRKKKFDTYGIGRVQVSMGFPSLSCMMEVAGKLGFSCVNPVDFSRKKDPEVIHFQRKESETSYLRFPLWIMYLFEPEDGPEEISERIRIINETANPVSSEGIVCIASHDFYGTRQAVCDVLEANGIQIQYPGNWRHNTERLKEDFADDKLAYLRSVRFNICPENTDTRGYVSEKLFDAFRTGVIPIYQGACNDPEPGLIRKEAVLFWDYEGNNSRIIQEIQRLAENNRAYEDFIHQPKLTNECAAYVWESMVSLREELSRVLQKS